MTPVPFPGDVLRSPTLPWLRRLRWTAVMGQWATVMVTVHWLGIPLPLVPVFLCIGLTALSNLALYGVPPGRGESVGVLTTIMAVDVLLLTALLHFTGGPHNPFTSFYLVHVALAAVALPLREALFLAAECSLGFSLLFLGHPYLPRPGDSVCGVGPDLPMRLHLRGMQVAFVLTAACVVGFAGRLQQALARARVAAAHHERFAGLATLAAGAAHELGTPLGTIQIAAAELARAAQRHPDDFELAEDAALIREEVTRCRWILDRLANEASDPAESLSLTEVIEEVRRRFDRRSVEIRGAIAPGPLVAPRQALVQALASLVKNGLDAGPPNGTVALETIQEADRMEFHVTDHGAGLSEEARLHAGEPFFTTKPPGSGVGLGLFLVRLLSQRMGGDFELVAHPMGGTRAVLRIPFRQGEPV
ncbi:MAG: HAMP domain-containing histidine kinase [Verrucomicrobiales bacterium]|nr:HAMP domain-containing histidine kinase [Verrucomicrobiales bacterium]